MNERIEVKPDLSFPRDVTATTEADHFRVEMHATFDAGRQAYRIVRVEVLSLDDEPITSAALRSIPLQERFTSALDVDIRTVGGARYEPRPINDFGPKESREFFIEAARIYAVARATLRNPLKAVADYYQVSQSTATRWATQARESGRID